MGLLVGLSFAQTFTFARPVAASVRDATGAVVTAGIDVARIDHDEDGNPLGLLVEGGATLGQADRCRSKPGDWAVEGPATVLLETLEGDTIKRTAIYTTRVRSTVDAMLGVLGTHRAIGAVPQYLRNLGGYVRYHELEWQLSASIIAIDRPSASLGDALGRALISG